MFLLKTKLEKKKKKIEVFPFRSMFFAKSIWHKFHLAVIFRLVDLKHNRHDNIFSTFPTTSLDQNLHLFRFW